jgi:hypothetical protein
VASGARRSEKAGRRSEEVAKTKVANEEATKVEAAKEKAANEEARILRALLIIIIRCCTQSALQRQGHHSAETGRMAVSQCQGACERCQGAVCGVYRLAEADR